MDAQQLEQYRQFFVEDVLFTKLESRQKAIALLLREGSPEAIGLVAEIVMRVTDPSTRVVALKGLHLLDCKQVVIDAVCRVWESSRDPDLTDLLIKRRWIASEPLELRVLSALQTHQLEVLTHYGVEILEPLLYASCDENPVIVERVTTVLVRLEQMSVLDQIWQNERYTKLAGFIIRKRWRYTSSVGLWVLNILIANELEVLLKNEAVETIKPLLHALQYDKSVIAKRAERVLRSYKQPVVHAAICRSAMEMNNLLAHSIAIATGYNLPDAGERALFYFLTRQWAKYESLDFDSHLLSVTYKVAPESIRNRIAEVAREAGRIEFIEIIAGGRQTQHISQMNHIDWELALDLLVNGRHWPELWELAQVVPPLRSAIILKRFVTVRWLPKKPEERMIFGHLKQLAQLCETDTLPLARLVELQAVLSERVSKVNSLAIMPVGKEFDSNNSAETLTLVSSLIRLVNIPVERNNLVDFLSLQQARRDIPFNQAEQNWLKFLEVLIGWKWRHEIELEDAPKRIATTEFDIELQA